MKKGLCGRVVGPKVKYGAETWDICMEERLAQEVMEIKCLMSMCGVTKMNE